LKAYKPYFRKVIAHHYHDSTKLVADIDSSFISILPDIQFASTSPNPMDKRMGIAAYFLATIEVLDKRGESFEKIRSVLIEIAKEYVRPKNYFHKLLKRLPPKIVNTPIARIILKRLDEKLSQKAHHNGFVTNIITDKNETYGFGYGIDIIECGICKLFEKHRYQKFSSILCEVDYITSELAGLKLIRSGTIANGAKKCDFRFTKEN
jgi:hypothetical protein